jgi:hypothetical protein
MPAHPGSKGSIPLPQEEPEIDVAAVLQEYMAESNARILDALQARHDELVEKLLNFDTSLAAGSLKKKP